MTASFSITALGFWGYLGLFLIMMLAWIGIVPVGQLPVIGAAALATTGDANIVLVIVVAIAGCSVGGMIGCQIGRRFKPLLAKPGIFESQRLAALDKGHKLYERYGPLAVFFLPAWVAGATEMRFHAFALWNFVSATIWVVGIGLATYFLGPEVAKLITNDLDKVVRIALAAAVVYLLIKFFHSRAGDWLAHTRLEHKERKELRKQRKEQRKRDR